jgi:hypothetical protein
MAQKRYEWFVEPGNDATNAVVAQYVPEENFKDGVMCSDGKRHYLWGCPSSLVTSLWKSKDSLKLDFRVFCKEGGGQIRDVTVIFKKRFKKARKQQKQQQQPEGAASATPN